jgi:fumarate hydratase class I
MSINEIIRACFEKTDFTAFETAEKPVLQDGRLFVPPVCLENLAEEAFTRVSFYYRRTHLELLNAALGMADTGSNEKLLIRDLIDNALTAAEGRLPLCQDTGSACVYAWKDEGVTTAADDGAFLEKGTGEAYRKRRFRASQLIPTSFFEERNTGNNLPIQLHIEAAPPPPDGRPCYRFLFAAKGGGSSNKTAYFPLTPAVLSYDEFDRFLCQKIEALGTAACPPYRLAVVLGGLSPEYNLEILKLATTELLDCAPYLDMPEDRPAPASLIYRDIFWEKRAMEIAGQSGLGAQVGGNRLVLDVRVLRLPRHAASCPVSIGVSCAAHRNMLAFIDERGVFLERLEEKPKDFLRSKPCQEITVSNPAAPPRRAAASRRIVLSTPLNTARAALSACGAGDALLLSGKLLVARDAAHRKWRELLQEAKPLPEYLFMYPIFYAGPSETPPGCVIGSIGPTTSARMDDYAEELLSRGASLVSIGKGGRSALWTEAASRYGGVYLTAAGGAAALIASKNVVSVKIIDYPELAMEAVRLLEVKDLRVFAG